MVQGHLKTRWLYIELAVHVIVIYQNGLTNFKPLSACPDQVVALYTLYLVKVYFTAGKILA